MKLDFKEIFDKWNADTQKIFSHDRSQTVGASEVFDCLRKVFFRKRGNELNYEKDADSEQSWGATRRGDLLENHYIVPAISNYLPQGAKLLYAGDDQKTLFYKRNSATPDGLIVGLSRDCLADLGIPDIKSDCIVLEMKTIDPRVGLKEEKSIHHGQAQIQMGLIRDTTPYKPFYAIVLYIDASFLDNIKPFVVEFSQEKWEAAQKRANTIWQYNKAEEIKPEGKIDNSCKFCEYKTACSLVSTGLVPPKKSTYKYDKNSEEEVAKIVAEIKELDSSVTENSKIIEEKKLQIKAILNKEKTRKMGRDNWTVSWYSQEGKESVDLEAMREDGIDVDSYKKRGNPFDVMRININ